MVYKLFITVNNGNVSNYSKKQIRQIQRLDKVQLKTKTMNQSHFKKQMFRKLFMKTAIEFYTNNGLAASNSIYLSKPLKNSHYNS